MGKIHFSGLDPYFVFCIPVDDPYSWMKLGTKGEEMMIVSGKP